MQMLILYQVILLMKQASQNKLLPHSFCLARSGNANLRCFRRDIRRDSGLCAEMFFASFFR